MAKSFTQKEIDEWNFGFDSSKERKKTLKDCYRRTRTLIITFFPILTILMFQTKA
jgi:hypothetical protein